MAEHDPRLTPARPDLAARHLEGVVEAERFVDGQAHQVVVPVLPLRKSPDPDGAQETQALYGEVFTVYDVSDGWAWGQSEVDGYVGYVEASGLKAPVIPATHKITALRAFRFSKPDLKSRPLDLLSMNSLISLGEADGSYRQEARGGWVWVGHTAAITEDKVDPAETALRFLGVPYFWGGRSSLGLDCSALVQNAWASIGQSVPRDADMQEAYFQSPLAGTILWSQGRDNVPWRDCDLRRGDLIFWPGHVGIMLDDQTMVHANATHMETSTDDLREIATTWEAEKGLHLRTIIRPSF